MQSYHKEAVLEYVIKNFGYNEFQVDQIDDVYIKKIFKKFVCLKHNKPNEISNFFERKDHKTSTYDNYKFVRKYKLKNSIRLIILLLLLFGLASPVSAIANLTYPNPINAPNIDIVNGTYTKDWIYYLLITNRTPSIWEFPVIGFAGSIMGPFTDAFKGLGAGNLVYLILWGVFIMMVWRQSGKITIPAMMGCITAGAWSLLMPESAQPWVTILICAALASQLMSFFAKE